MSDDLKFQLAKNEMVESINNIIDKYNLPLVIVEIILSNVLEEVSYKKNERIQKEMEEYKSKRNGGNDE